MNALVTRDVNATVGKTREQIEGYILDVTMSCSALERIGWLNYFAQLGKDFGDKNLWYVATHLLNREVKGE